MRKRCRCTRDATCIACRPGLGVTDTAVSAVGPRGRGGGSVEAGLLAPVRLASVVMWEVRWLWGRKPLTRHIFTDSSLHSGAIGARSG